MTPFRQLRSSSPAGGVCKLPPSLTLLLLLLVAFPLPTQSICGLDPRQVVVIPRTNGSLAVAICSSRVARIVRTDGTKLAQLVIQKRTSLTVQPGYAQPRVQRHASAVVNFTVTHHDDILSIQTSEMRLDVSMEHEPRIGFYSTTHGTLVTQEIESKFTTTNTSSSVVKQSWRLAPGEALYGGGQFVNGHVNYAAASMLWVQSNTEAVVPMVLSSKGYGIFWDQYGITRLNPPVEGHEIVLDNHGRGAWKVPPFPATTTTNENTDNYFWMYVQVCANDHDDNFYGFGCGNDHFELFLDGTSVCEYQLHNIPLTLSCRIPQDINIQPNHEYQVELKVSRENNNNDGRRPRLFWTSRVEQTSTVLESRDASHVMDYYFLLAGMTNDYDNNNDNPHLQHQNNNNQKTPSPSLETVLQSYREITGTAALASKWVFGFWQCKERYHNQSELLTAAATFRKLGIPVDNIVQDWHYWGDLGWGPQWDPKIYPDPQAMVEQLHDLHLQLMVSAWSKFDAQTRFYQDLQHGGLLIHGSDYMDVWNPATRAKYWNYVRSAHFDIGVDAMWLDATEPEYNPHANQEIFLGQANEYYNTYSLLVSQAVYDGLQSLDGRRVFSLTRSSFAGQQRYGAALWSGDTTASWDSLRRQVAMSINYQLSGMPYWSMDTGGFFRPWLQYTSPDYKLLLTRWFQFAVFTPIMRVHGCASNTELWHYGPDTQNDIVYGSIHLRYRLLDYIYSNFAKVERQHYTVQRGLILDFGIDPVVPNIADEFMFGQSFLVAPIYTPSNSRSVYLPTMPSGGKWRNFFSGEPVPAGNHMVTNVPLRQLPLFVQSSIVVLSHLRQHVFDDEGEKTLEVRVYDGLDSHFTLYQDDGLDPAKDRPYCEVIFLWNDRERYLHVASRTGPNCREKGSLIVLQVILVGPGHGVGIKPSPTPDATVVYDGTERVVKLDGSSNNRSRTIKADLGILVS